VASPQGDLGFRVPIEVIDALAHRLADAVTERVAERITVQPTLSPWLTFEQARAHLGFSRDALYKLSAARAIPVRKKHDGQGLRFHRDELDAWMETQYPRVDRLG
jgi:excisionase family DNA binding protein